MQSLMNFDLKKISNICFIVFNCRCSLLLSTVRSGTFNMDLS